jgi:hypothetical protein
MLNKVNTKQVKKPNQDPLAKILKSATMKGNTIILTQANEENEAWMSPNSLFDLFLEGFHAVEGIKHLSNHLLMVILDQKGFDKCNSLHKNCHFLKSEKKEFG